MYGFCGSKKASDTVEHETVLGKLSYYGVRNTELKWLSSYIRNKRQCCKDKNI